jgi:catechol-2,3-dioxygenase
MTMHSVTNFPGTSRLHFALGVQNLASSIQFYSQLFGIAPDKQRSGYARFSPSDPSLNMSLNQEATPKIAGGVQHYGVQVKDRGAINQMSERLRQAGYVVEAEMAVTCCYAVQDKVWTQDPDGNRWEIFVTQDDQAEVASANRSVVVSCCASTVGCCGV